MLNTLIDFYHSDDFIPQFFGLISFVLGALCFCQKNDRRFKLFMLIMNLNHMIHFILMEAINSALSALLAMVRTYISIKIKSLYFAVFFILLTLMLNSFWVNEWFDWLSVIGSCFGTFALFCLQGIKLRLVMLLGTLCWLANNIIIGSIGGVMLELMILIISLLTIIRLKRAA